MKDNPVATARALLDTNIEPASIRTPIQLTAAWFATLVLLVGALLGGAAAMPHDERWLTPVLVIAAVCIIPTFVVAVFRLQTKYRSELLSDHYYARVRAAVASAAAERGFEISAAAPDQVAKRAVRNFTSVVGARVLWVDDHPAWSEIESAALEQLGIYAIDYALSTNDALERLTSGDYDLIITDMTRGDDDKAGLELIARAKAVTQAPIIVYLGELRPELGTPGGAFGITNRPDELINLVLDALERVRS
jgi:CheY-like chemotaxis protein